MDVLKGVYNEGLFAGQFEFTSNGISGLGGRRILKFVERLNPRLEGEEIEIPM